mmetsp:Transcript_19492/g.49559  ORF Transcript_19492/g.49559 Transcript_19492/m.49559 type:complete len:186 (+) Transcript_19492:827-1384(+)
MAHNEIIKLLRTAEPNFDGNYVPSLDAAEALLLCNPHSGCALQLLFLSDGRPSETCATSLYPSMAGMKIEERISALTQERIGAHAARFGRRLSVHTVGFGVRDKRSFEVLQQMAAQSELCGSLGNFYAVSLKPESPGLALSSLAHLLTTTRTELTELGVGGAQRTVRDVRREVRNLADDEALSIN